MTKFGPISDLILRENQTKTLFDKPFTTWLLYMLDHRAPMPKMNVSILRIVRQQMQFKGWIMYIKHNCSGSRILYTITSDLRCSRCRQPPVQTFGDQFRPFSEQFSLKQFKKSLNRSAALGLIGLFRPNFRSCHPFLHFGQKQRWWGTLLVLA